MISLKVFSFFALVLTVQCLDFHRGTANNKANGTGVDELVSKALVKAATKTYYIETSATANWYEANNFCRYHGMQPASITREDDYEILKNHLTDVGLDSELFWVSGNDLANWGEYVWDSTGQKFEFTDWAIGQPDHMDPSDGSGVEHCILILYGPDKKWDDSHCVKKFHFICEF